MPLQATSGAASYDAFGGGVAAVPQYIEDVFSTYLYTGNGSTQTITNGIDLSGEGGLVWLKARSVATAPEVYDTARGAGFTLQTSSTGVQGDNSATAVTSFNAGGFTMGSRSNINGSGTTLTSWTFRKQSKFFDMVTYTGDGTSGLRYINQSLGSAPGFIIVKKTSSTGNWFCYSRGLPSTNYSISLNLTDAATDNGLQVWDSTTTQFAVHSGLGLNANGATYVAYLFAHNAGGFGLTGTDNVISCGSYTGNGSANGPTVTLGYEPQWLLIKNASDISNWTLVDNMRRMSVLALSSTALLYANLSNAEAVDRAAIPLATGFQINDDGSAVNTSGATYIYIAIRRGPMKVPTSGTSVFAPVARAGTSTATTVTTGFPVDFIMSKGRNPSFGYGENWGEFDRLRGLAVLSSNNTGTEFTSPTYQLGIADFANNTGMNLSASDNDYGYINKSGYNYGTYFLRRAPSFFDEVCYTGTGVAKTVAHNLGVAPELMIFKTRNNGSDWMTYAAPLGATKRLLLNGINAAATDSFPFANTAPTSTVFTVGTSGDTNPSGLNQIAYLFATCAGVSKVGSYTGTGTTKQIDCGFTGGARFVLIKRTDSTGSWYVWDVARGISSGNDPYLLLNSTAAEVTNTDYIDAYSAGFEISSTAPAEINASGGSFIFLAIS